MKNLMHYTRQLHQRRINAFFFSEAHNPREQLSLSLGPKNKNDRLSALRRLAAEQEYDVDDDRS